MQHRRVTVITIIAVLVFLIAPAVHGQYDDRWSATILVKTYVGGQDYGQPQSIDLITLSAGTPDSRSLMSAVGVDALSAVYTGGYDPATQRVVLFGMPTSDAANTIMTIVEVGTGRSYMAEMFAPQITALDTVTFSPDRTLIAAAYLILDPAPTQGQPRSGIAIWDAATGSFIRAKAYAELVGRPEEGELYGWPYLGEWTAAGIQWHENCYACEGVFSGEWSLWDPATDAVTPATGVFFDRVFSDAFPVTGERVLTTTYPGLPVASIPGMFTAQNVIQYSPDGRIALPYAPDLGMPIVFFDVAMRNLRRPLWIADGMSILAHDPSTNRYAIISRTGEVQDFSYSGSMSPLFGTPSGWVALVSPDEQTYRLTEFVPAFGGIEAIDLGVRWSQRVAIDVLRGPDLGASLLGSNALPPLTPINFPGPQEIEAMLIEAGLSCPGLLPSRLYPGGLALVTPGSPNNLRAEASSGSALLGQIPAGDIVEIVSGPVCDSAGGLAWWQVKYQGTPGYTVEIFNGQYALEPMQF